VPSFAYTLTEHNPAKPWLIVGQEHRTVDLADSTNFFEWAGEQWLAPRWSVQLDPRQLAPWADSP
jgi:hypothetical protein